ncbi:hypothetical protein EYF80_037811 [Liparis tanakae]|uniref:Uncharacterized protein n=1 Tax=Liparis tanakae TaxID=230148 RepID=A0A4Z2GFR7_9TELE|nr:hypothetical protein EYF80_037811 [Liparis tanakae]
MAGIRRVNGKLSGISPAVSCGRIRQVQSLLCDGGISTPDGILCSLGIDSRYNEGCTELAKYLFYGLYGRNALILEHNFDEFPDEMLDDVILLIKADCVHLYCNPMNYSYLLPYVSHWRNLHLYCMTEAEYEDEEAAEEFKISSFVTMVQDCYRIGVPHSSQGHFQRFDMFMVEKWPLIQAFALEGIGRGSFFTMKYKLMDMSENLWQVYNRLDPVSLDNLLTEDLVNFEKQWSGFFSSMDLESHLSILELSEAQAGEAFRTYYSHGLISSNITDKSKSQQPFMLFGKHSSSEDLEGYSFNFASESHQVRNTGAEASAARHMIYSAAVQAVLSGIKCYSFTSSATKAKDVAENTFLVALDSMNLSQYRSSLRSKCEFLIQAVNMQGRIIPLTDKDSRYVVKTASMKVHDIPDLQWDGGDLGSVVFSESFLESSINIQQKDGTVSSDSCYTILTTTVPRYACWLDSSAVASLLVEYDSSLLPNLPFPLHSADHCLVFALQPRSKSYRAFYSKVLSVWQKSESGLNLQMVDQMHLTWNQKTMHSRLQKLHDSQEPPVAKRRGSLKTSYSQLPEQDMFLQHFALSSIGQEPILYDHLGVLFPSAELRNPVNGQGDEVVITIITGLPGSHKERLCNFLVQLNKEHGRWVVYRPAPDSCDGFSASHLQQYLSSFLESQRGPGGKPRLLVVSPGYTDVLDVVQAVLLHPDPVVQACFTIGAVTACVDPLASCVEHRFAFPKLLEQCSQGIVSTVVFTGLTAEQKHPLTQHVQQLVRSANPTAAFVPAERGATLASFMWAAGRVNNSPAKDKMQHKHLAGSPPNFLTICVMCKGRFVSGCGSLVLTQQRVAFNRPLERPLFVTRCKELKSSLRPSPFRGNMYNVRGKVRFSDSGKLMEVSYNTSSGNLSISADPVTPRPEEADASCALTFDGVGLTEDGLKDWLRLCAKQRQKKKLKKTKNSLSPQELKSIHMTRHLDRLPQGYFYNGHQYVDIFGEKMNLHPYMEDFIKEYLAEANTEVELFNRQLELQGQPDLFDP